MKKILFTFFILSFLPKFLAQDGTIDTSFQCLNPKLPKAILTQPDGRIIYFKDQEIGRLNINGDYDSSFLSTSNVDKINSVALQKDGKIIVAGKFSTFRQVPKNDIVRLNPNGTIDTSFDSGIGVDNSIYSVKIQQDGKILITGNFNSYNNNYKNCIARLNSDGSFDNTFVGLGTNATAYVPSVSIQSDNKIIIAGGFTSYNNSPISYIARLNSDGSLDTSFLASLDSQVSTCAIQDDGKILVAKYNDASSSSAQKLIRLNIDGSVDNSFNIGSGFNSSINTIYIQQNGKIIVGGSFSKLNNIVKNNIAKLNSNGIIDVTFNEGIGTNGPVNTIVQHSASKILIAGYFSYYNGVSGSIARLMNDSTLSVSDSLNSSDELIFTNPVGNILTVNLKDTIQIGEIFSASGQKFKEFTNKNLNLSDLSTGIYIMKLKVNDKILTRKFIKK